MSHRLPNRPTSPRPNPHRRFRRAWLRLRRRMRDGTSRRAARRLAALAVDIAVIVSVKVIAEGIYLTLTQV